MTGRVLAVDLGATSVRVCAVDLDAEPPTVEVLHRVPNSPVRHGDGSLRWDWAAITAAVETGLERGLASGPVASIGVDAWGCDYGLIDADGRLLSDPHSYRSDRTASWRELADRIGPEVLYRTTGIQLMAFNTVFQLGCHDRTELDRAESLLMMPELVVHHLTGVVTAERTSAGTTALVDVSTGEWSSDLLAAVAVDRRMMPAIAAPGSAVGAWHDVPVHLVAGHDTASAVVATPLPDNGGAAFVSSGTWLLVGTERETADLSDAARDLNFSNEPSAFSGVRLLKNVPGLWLLEQCRPHWGATPVPELVAAAAAVPPGPVIDVLDDRFLNPADMLAEVCAAAGLPTTGDPAVVVRCLLESIAAAAATVIDQIRALGASVTEVDLVGGGARLSLLAQLLEEHTVLPVRTGPAEATAVGNALVQGVALGRFPDLSAARRALRPRALAIQEH